ncbi:MAG: hypothetical protein ACRDHM_07395 [Actinomycetota bacterium]
MSVLLVRDELWVPRGHVLVRVFGPDDRLKLEQVNKNLITQVGDQYLMERAVGIASPPGQVTGARLGTGTTAPAKTGAGAAIVTYKSGTSEAIDATYPQSSLSGSSRRITWRITWEAGEGTDTALAEIVLTNESPLTDVAGSVSNTISRALISPTVNKGANDTLEITWSWDGLGA